jgi:hypothetical protein
VLEKDGLFKLFESLRTRTVIWSTSFYFDTFRNAAEQRALLFLLYPPQSSFNSNTSLTRIHTTGFQSQELIVKAGLTLGDVSQYPVIDVTIDGADE